MSQSLRDLQVDVLCLRLRSHAALQSQMAAALMGKGDASSAALRDHLLESARAFMAAVEHLKAQAAIRELHARTVTEADVTRAREALRERFYKGNVTQLVKVKPGELVMIVLKAVGIDLVEVEDGRPGNPESPA